MNGATASLGNVMKNNKGKCYCLVRRDFLTWGKRLDGTSPREMRLLFLSVPYRTQDRHRGLENKKKKTMMMMVASRKQTRIPCRG